MDMTRGQYDSIPKRMNWSRLKVMARSPAHFRHALFSDRADTDAFRLGRCAHLAVLEPEKFAAECAIWDGGRRAGKAWDAFVEANHGRELLKEEEAAFCRAIQSAVREDPHAAPYLASGAAEATVLAALDGVDCKSRMDWLSSTAIVDLKTTRDASPEGFAREVWRMRHDAQSAMYQDMHEAATGVRLPVVLIAVEKEQPHLVQVYVVPDPVLEVGRDHYRMLLERLRDCRQRDAWPGYVDGVTELSLPRWANAFDDEEDITGMGLVFSEVA